MRRLWILAILLMPLLAGGCKVCYSWQFGRDRAPEGQQPPMCASPCEAPCSSCGACGAAARAGPGEKAAAKPPKAADC